MLRALAWLPVALTLALAGCGEKNEPEITGPPVVDRPPTEPTDPGEPTVGDGTGGVELAEVGEFEAPVFLAQAPGGNALYVVEQGGRVLRVPPRGGRPRPFLDISGQVDTEGAEQGLLSIAFAPDFRRSRRFYVDYTNRSGDTRVVEYRTNRAGTRARAGSARTILRVAQPADNHNGGLLLFGPDDNLYIGLGDGGGAGDPQGNGQDLSTLLGSILRIDPARGRPYRIPRSNPFTGSATGEAGARGEILAYGLRNPWRFSFDRETGDLWIGDVGQSDQEEVDALRDGRLTSGANFGWSAFEGTARFNENESATDPIEPVLTYGRGGGCSITGGYVVRDTALESLYGRYVYADFCAGQLRSFSAEDAARRESATDDVALGVQVPSIGSFAEDARGRIYAISLEGPVYRLAPGG